MAQHASFCGQCGWRLTTQPEPQAAEAVVAMESNSISGPATDAATSAPMTISIPRVDRDALVRSGSFLSTLFDWRFMYFVSLRLIRVLYIVAVVVAAILGLIIFVTLAQEGGVWILLGLILAPVLAIVFLVIVRVVLEFYAAVFRLSENSGAIVNILLAEDTKP